jgi:DNA polymerase-3 subunit delta
VALQIVLWALSREIRALTGMATAVAEGDSVGAVIGRYRIWQARRKIIETALLRVSADECRSMMRHCALIDRIGKGRAAGNAWDELLQLTLKLAGKSVLPASVELEQVS